MVGKNFFFFLIIMSQLRIIYAYTIYLDLYWKININTNLLRISSDFRNILFMLIENK